MEKGPRKKGWPIVVLISVFAIWFASFMPWVYVSEGPGIEITVSSVKSDQGVDHDAILEAMIAAGIIQPPKWIGIDAWESDTTVSDKKIDNWVVVIVASIFIALVGLEYLTASFIIKRWSLIFISSFAFFYTAVNMIMVPLVPSQNVKIGYGLVVIACSFFVLLIFSILKDKVLFVNISEINISDVPPPPPVGHKGGRDEL
jgi:hypothetical protein